MIQCIDIDEMTEICAYKKTKVKIVWLSILQYLLCHCSKCICLGLLLD